MASVNKWIGIGNLGADPETRFMQNGDAVTNIRIACTESWKEKSTGEKKESTEWVRVVFYRKLAEIVGQYLKKGAPVYIEGRIRTRKWTDKEGQERYTTEIEATEMQMLGGRQGSSEHSAGSSESSSNPERSQQRNAQGAPKQSFEDDGEIPFTPHGAGRAWRVI